MKTTGKDSNSKHLSSGASRDMVPPEFLGRVEFLHALRLEEKRARRSGMAFGVVRIEATEQSQALGERLVEELRHSLRDTDLCGWFEAGSAAGVIFIELFPETALATGRTLTDELRAGLIAALPEARKLRFSFSTYPPAQPAAVATHGKPARQGEPQAVGRR